MPESNESLLLDVMLGKLAVYLRMCGLDAAYAGDLDLVDDEVIHRLANADGRVLLSRDVELVARADSALLIESLDVADQLSELAEAGVTLEVNDPPIRCGRCNGVLEPEVPELPRPEYAPEDSDVDCYRCRACDQYFWGGSHVADLTETLAEIPEIDG